MKSEIAVLFAAGKGTRLLPLTDEIPKPLIKVHGIPMIETLINAFLYRGIKEIYIVVGYKKEQFLYLAEKYQEVILVENKEYAEKNNISSFYAMGDFIGKENCFLCDADLFVCNKDVFLQDFENSCFFGKYVQGKTDEWVFKLCDGRMTHLCIGGENDYNLVGISYWLKKDADFLKTKIREAYSIPGHESLFWEEIADRFFDEIYATVFPVEKGDVLEIDTFDELCMADLSYVKK